MRPDARAPVVVPFIIILDAATVWAAKSRRMLGAGLSLALHSMLHPVRRGVPSSAPSSARGAQLKSFDYAGVCEQGPRAPALHHAATRRRHHKHSKTP
jgi:hypothetical protein